MAICKPHFFVCVICLFDLTFRRPKRGTSRANSSTRCWQGYHESFPSTDRQATPLAPPQPHMLQHPFTFCLVIPCANHALCGVKSRTAVSGLPAAMPSCFGFVLKKFFSKPKSSYNSFYKLVRKEQATANRPVHLIPLYVWKACLVPVRNALTSTTNGSIFSIYILHDKTGNRVTWCQTFRGHFSENATKIPVCLPGGVLRWASSGVKTERKVVVVFVVKTVKKYV